MRSVEESTIADKFANHFHGAYSYNSASRAAELYAEYRRSMENYQGPTFVANFDIDLVSCVLSKPKRGKAVDLDNLAAEHLIYSHPILTSILLCKLFNLILASSYRYIPTTGQHLATRFRFVNCKIAVLKLQQLMTSGELQ